MKLPQCGRALILLGLIMSFKGPAFCEPPSVESRWNLLFPGSFNGSQCTPAIASDGTLYLGTFQGKFLAVTPEGSIKWILDVNCEIKSSPAIADDGTIYFGSRNRKFYALGPDGQLKWRFATGGWIDSSPAIAIDGTIYFGCDDKKLYALNPDGTKKWELAAGGIVDSSPAIAKDGTIYFGAHDNKFYALSPEGKVRWTYPTGGPIISSPAIGPDGSIYFSSTDGNLYALKFDGTEEWHYHTGGMTESSPTLDEEGNIYIGVNRYVIQTFTAGGKLRWTRPSEVLMDQSVAIATGRVYASVPWLAMHALQPSDRKALWRMTAAFNLTATPAIGANGTVYSVCYDYLYAVQPPDGALPALKSAWPVFRANARHTGRVVD